MYPDSPPTLRPQRSNPRKREYDHHDASEEPENERRRQADDVTPKLKRKQPKVAEAYRLVDSNLFFVLRADVVSADAGEPHSPERRFP